MRIALIRKNYTPYGGAENYMRLIAEKLDEHGHDVHILSSGDWENGNYIFHKIKTISKPSFVSNIMFAQGCRRLLLKESFDVIFSFERVFDQDIYRAGDGCHKEWLRRRSITESFIRNISFSVNPLHIAILWLEKKCFNNSSAIITNSKMVKKEVMDNYSIPENKLHVIYNGVDVSRFHPLTDEEKISKKKSLNIKDDKVVLFVGADFKRKGLLTLLEALSLMDCTNTRLIVAGKHPKKPYMDLTEKFGITKQVTFRGPEQQIEALYSIADVFVLPTIYDPFSNATLEAMASGVPVITTTANGASEIINDGEEGFVVSNPLDAVVFSEKIRVVLSNNKEMGNKARLKAEAFSIDKVIDKVTEVISEVRT